MAESSTQPPTWLTREQAEDADEVLIRRALDFLPTICRYHGVDIEDPVHTHYRYSGACCETGMPALARRRALAVLDARRA